MLKLYPRKCKHKSDGNDEDNPGHRAEFNKEIETLRRTQTEMKMN